MAGQRNIRLLIINQSFYPDFDATGQFNTELAEDLTLKGIEVSVLSGQGVSSKRYEFYKGIHIFRVWQTKFNKRNLFGRYLNYLSLFAGFLIKGVFSPKVDVILLGSSPPFLYVIGIIISALKRAKLVYCIKDLYPDIAVKLNLIKNKLLITLLVNLAKGAYRFADKIIVIGPYMRSLVLARGANPDKVVLIHDWADHHDIVPMPKEQTAFYRDNKAGLAGKFILQYSGNMGMAHEFDTILQAGEILQKEQPNIVFMFIGDGVQKNYIQAEVKRRRLVNTIFFPYQSRNYINQSLNTCDLSLVTMKHGFEGKIIPSKIYGLLAVGKPIIFIGNEHSEIGDIVKNNNCGYVVEIGDHLQLVRLILLLFNNHDQTRKLGSNARQTLETYFTREKSVEKYFQLIKSL